MFLKFNDKKDILLVTGQIFFASLYLDPDPKKRKIETISGKCYILSSLCIKNGEFKGCTGLGINLCNVGLLRIGVPPEWRWILDGAPLAAAREVSGSIKFCSKIKDMNLKKAKNNSFL
jgi:hypothetical protein